LLKTTPWTLPPETGLPRLKRGQVGEVNFEPQTHKVEPARRGRPAPIVQTNILNGAGHATTIVIHGTTQKYRDAQGDACPLRVAVGRLGKARQETDLLIDQIRSIANQRFLRDRPLAELSRAQMKRVEEALRILTGEQHRSQKTAGAARPVLTYRTRGSFSAIDDSLHTVGGQAYR